MTKSLATIRKQLRDGDYELSRHAFRRAVERNISETEMREAGNSAVIIEEYPTDKYSPSCLLLGFTSRSRPLHIQVSRVEGETTRVITVYEPDLVEWNEGYTVRR